MGKKLLTRPVKRLKGGSINNILIEIVSLGRGSDKMCLAYFDVDYFGFSNAIGWTKVIMKVREKQKKGLSALNGAKSHDRQYSLNRCDL